MSKKNGVSWVRKAEPKFIREFKERIAYKEQSSVDTKVNIDFKQILILIHLNCLLVRNENWKKTRTPAQLLKTKMKRHKLFS